MKGFKKLKKTGDLKYVYKSKLDKVYFAYDAVYTDSKDLAKRTASDMILKSKTYEVALDPKYDGYQRGLPSMVYTFFDKKIGSGTKPNVNEKLPQELRKTVIKKFKRKKMHSTFKDNIWAADLAHIG